MNNILKKELDCTCKDFIAEVYGKKSKTFTFAATQIFSSLLTQSSTLVKKLSMPLRCDRSGVEVKRVQEKVSRWLANYDFVSDFNPYLLKVSSAQIDERTTIAMDFSDISKEFGGNGMEGMEMGWDGSRGCTAMGHDFICASLVGAQYKEAVPVYAKLGKGRHCKSELLYGAIDTVMSHTGGKGTIVVDRGMDDAKFIYRMKRDGRVVVVRINKMDRDVFGNGEAIDKSLKRVPFTKVLLNTYRGARKAEIRYAAGVLQYCSDPKSKNAVVYDVKILVVESRFDGKSIYMYAIMPDWDINDCRLSHEKAVQAAQSYCDRWQIETSFQTVKQEFKLEEARVRIFKRLVNIFVMCILAYVFMTRYLRSVKRFKKIVKLLGDNVETLAFKTHSLLCAIRDLYTEAKVRFISGRPHKKALESSFQMVFKLE